MSDQVKDIVIPILKQMQGDLAAAKSDIMLVKENTSRMDGRLKSIESHMSGFMSTSRYHDTEIDELRGRVKALEEIIKQKQ